MQSILLILGPTASGKSAYGVAMARRHDGEIINMDSMQVYADLQILTARPTSDDMVGIHIICLAMWMLAWLTRQVFGWMKRWLPLPIFKAGVKDRSLLVAQAFMRMR